MEQIKKGDDLSQSLDIVNDNIAKIKTLFPEAVAEGKIDFKVLQDILGEEIETDEEYYRFTWAGKTQARREAHKPSTGTLRPCVEESVNWATTQNLYIEGDNLEVLKLLQKSYANKVKMIYIDPPYNTGKDFVYKDNYKDNLRNYQEQTGQIDSDGNRLSTNTDSDGRYHSNWLNMIYPRLRLAKNLLKEDGVIFISIDDHEVENLRKNCDEIFGESNFLGNLILQTATDNNPTQINTEHEYILCFAKNSALLNNWFAPSNPAELIIEKYKELKERFNSNTKEIQIALRVWLNTNKANLPKVTHYDNVDENGVFHDGDIANTRYGGYEYEILHPITGKPCKVPEKGFRYPKETLLKMIEEDNVVFGDDETTLIKPKKRVEDVRDMLRTMIYEDGRASTKIVDNLLDRGVFDNPKSITILSRIMSFILQDNDIVLDFFSGSGSTAHATFQLQIERKEIRLKNIQIQLPENMELSLQTADTKTKKTLQKAISFLKSLNKKPLISELGKERIRRAGGKIIKKQEALLKETIIALKNLENDQLLIKNEDKISELRKKIINLQAKINNLDIGFKVFKLDSSNIKAWDGSTINVDGSQIDINFQLKDIEKNIKAGRTEEDVLFEILLKYGLDLTLPIEEKMIEGKKVFNVGLGALFICLANDITNKVAEGIGAWKQAINPETCRVIFKDAGFTDVEKANAVQTLKRYGIHEIKSI